MQESSFYESAGLKGNFRNTGSVRECFKGFERPDTPEKMKKFRKSARETPGMRFTHPGIVDDMHQFEDSKSVVFGMSSDLSRETTADALNHPGQSNEIEKMHLEHKESVYLTNRREPLGRGYTHGSSLPPNVDRGAVFGKPPFQQGSSGTASDWKENAKDLLFPRSEKDRENALEGFDESVGRQTTRSYDWPFDPNQARFGEKSMHHPSSSSKSEPQLDGNQVKDILSGRGYYESKSKGRIVSKRLEDFRSTRNALGKPRKLGFYSNPESASTTSLASGTHTNSAQKFKEDMNEVIFGTYGREDQLPDSDLGTTLTPGFRNSSIEHLSNTHLRQQASLGQRSFSSHFDEGKGQEEMLASSIVYGAPSSVLNSSSFAGDQDIGGKPVQARDILNPTVFDDKAITEATWQEERSLPNMKALFRSIGSTQEDVSDDLFDEIWEQACATYRKNRLTIDEFRVLFNEVLYLQEQAK